MLHLIHPALVHFAVAFLIAGGLVEAAGHVTRKPAWVRYGGSLVVLGTIFLVPTVVSGFLAQNSVAVPADARAAALLVWHERVGLALLAAFSAALLWKGWGGGAIPERQRFWFAAFLLLAVALTALGALLGGAMVYEHGVGVAVLG